MAKVFTIAQGLENMGAMRTGGQGSVYKGRRIGEIITAIKLLPTPIFSENPGDKSYRDFTNEVEKLKKVNEEPCPNVVRILSSGLSETGNFPFIEMEFIEGPDLEELLQPPHEPIFTIKEMLKVARHLSNALSHCHKKNITHGDVKSNNVKFNLHTNNYVLLDFGLAAMTDEQRRTSLRQAGAVEFMAPEQNEGQILFQSDVYSFGVIMFELIAGRVPFPLADKGETARNAVRLSHMETLPPDVLELRKKALPQSWSHEKKEAEMKVPEWFVNLVYKCLKKKPENRFYDGVQLNDYIVYHCSHNPFEKGSVATAISKGDNLRLENENEQLIQQLAFYKQELEEKERQLADFKAGAGTTLPSNSYQASQAYPHETRSNKGVSATMMFLLLLVALSLGALVAYTLLNKRQQQNGGTSSSSTTDTSMSAKDTSHVVAKKADTTGYAKKAEVLKKQMAMAAKKSDTAKIKRQVKEDEAKKDNGIIGDEQTPESNFGIKYKVISKAYFFSGPDDSTRRTSYMNASESTMLIPLKEENGFIYISGTDQRTGKKVTGWLKKSDLKEVEE